MTLLSRRLFLKLSASAAIAGNVQANDGRHKTGLVIDDRFLAHKISDTHPESPARYRAVKSHLLAENFHKKLTLIKPKADADSWLSKVHSIDHINEIKSNQPATYKNALLATAGVLAAIDSVCTGEVNNAFCASRPPGHHAKNTGQEAGFCYFNHVAIGARYAQEHYQLNKILIIDWDYHHGNGTEWAFYSDPTVLYFSTHDMFAYPGTGLPGNTGEGEGEGFNINVHLGCGAKDEDIITAFKEKLLPAADAFEPDLILISAGFDSRKDDLLGCHNISDQGFSTLTKIVRMIADRHADGKIVSVLEGGYNIEGNANAVVAHIKALVS
ncbi:MAG: histone deacetylase [Gammaproteobacteria bacterium]|nr:MAG: histone deacetylase [Gammaproteobacteria bacterium]